MSSNPEIILHPARDESRLVGVKMSESNSITVYRRLRMFEDLLHSIASNSLSLKQPASAVGASGQLQKGKKTSWRCACPSLLTTTFKNKD